MLLCPSVSKERTDLVFLALIEQQERAKKKKRKNIEKDYDTWCSQVVSNPSTNQARRGLTSLIRREVVLSSWYGRNNFTISLSLLKLFAREQDDSMQSRLASHQCTHMSNPSTTIDRVHSNISHHTTWLNGSAMLM